MTTRIVFGIGSNLGNKEFYLDSAVEKLVERLNLKDLKRSKIFKNPAMLLPDSPKEWNMEFFNIAISANIDLKKFDPEKILQVVKDVEKDLGRQERAKWAPREIDIDILLIGDLEIRFGERLVIPHPGLKDREFFRKTVAEIM